MAATSNQNTPSKTIGMFEYPVDGGSHIYKGTMVCVNASGFAVPAADTSGFSNVVGVADEEVDASNDSDGVKKIRVVYGRAFRFAATGITQAMVGTTMLVKSDVEVDNSSSNNIKAGMLIGFISTTEGWVFIGAPLITPVTIAAGDLGTDSVTAEKLNGALGVGIIPLDITTARIISSNAIQNTTEGGVPDGNTAPSLARINAATDKALVLAWAAASVAEVQFPSFAYPPDLDDGAILSVHLLVKMAGAADTPVIAVGYFEGIGDTNAGGNTGAASAALQELTVNIAAADIGAAPNFATVCLTPGAHGTDILSLYAAWIEYVRKDN